eukprot:scaffold1726_cov30-Prasinocladus_malaysianus.AAC.1
METFHGTEVQFWSAPTDSIAAFTRSTMCGHGGPVRYVWIYETLSAQLLGNRRMTPFLNRMNMGQPIHASLTLGDRCLTVGVCSYPRGCIEPAVFMRHGLLPRSD